MPMPYEEAAADPAYRTAYTKVMGGHAELLTEQEKAAVQRVRSLAGTAVGYPTPPEPSAPAGPAPAPTYRID